MFSGVILLVLQAKHKHRIFFHPQGGIIWTRLLSYIGKEEVLSIRPKSLETEIPDVI